MLKTHKSYMKLTDGPLLAVYLACLSRAVL